METGTSVTIDDVSIQDLFSSTNNRDVAAGGVAATAMPLDVLQHLVETKVITKKNIRQAIEIIQQRKKTKQIEKAPTTGNASLISKDLRKKEAAGFAAPPPLERLRTRHIALKFFYDGSQYSGLAQNVGQDHDCSVEKALFQALLKSKLVESRESCRYSRCGRTDRGVSAAGQVVALQLKSAIPMDATWQQGNDSTLVQSTDLPKNEYESISVWVFPRSKTTKNNSDTVQRTPKELKEYPYTKILNNLLPPSIRILGWAPVTSEFSARFSATTRLYRYFFCRKQLDLSRIQQALGLLEGTHDFRNFCKMDVEKVYNFQRQIYSARLCKRLPSSCQDESQRATVTIIPQQRHGNPHEVYYLEILGQAFLWHQIRCIAEVVLSMVGEGLEEPSVVTELLDVAKCPGKPSYPLADEKPLVLHDCGYHDLSMGYSVQNLWTVSCQLEQQWEEQTLAAARLRNCTDSLRECRVRKDDLKDFCTAKITERNRKRRKVGQSLSTDEVDLGVDALLEKTDSTTMAWSACLEVLHRLDLFPDCNGLKSSRHVPLMQRSKGTTYDEKVESLKKSDKRRQKYNENVIKKRKTSEEDAAFYGHMMKQGGAGI
jgi:tRNA pseudouridine38/39 synthase